MGQRSLLLTPYSPMKKNWHQYLLHITGWLFLYILPYLFSFEGVPNIFTIFSHPGDYVHVISFALLVVFVYVDHWQFVPKFYLKAQYISFIIILAVGFWVVTVLPLYIVPRDIFRNGPPLLEPLGPPRPHGPHPFFFGRNYTIILYILSVITSITIHTRKQIHNIEKQKLHAELSLLKARINPHFLFNTLNSIYALVINKDEKAADAIVQLSELMRYTLKDTVDDLVDLDKEVNYIRNYIALQEARLGDTVKVEQNISGDFGNKKIPPLLLITFIENAFKHGVNPNKLSEIRFDLSVEGNTLKLFVKNKQVSSISEESGIGLQNIKERLKLLYPSRHQLSINDNKDNYTVELVITLQ